MSSRKSNPKHIPISKLNRFVKASVALGLFPHLCQTNSPIDKAAALLEQAGYERANGQSNRKFVDEMTAAILGETEQMAKRLPDGYLKRRPRKPKVAVTSAGVFVTRMRAVAPLPAVDPTRDAFLESFEWRQLRMRVLKRYGPVCMCCGATPASSGEPMNVDHIKPRRKYPELALDFDNLQVLCHPCNHGKGNWDETDWRPKTS
jgi:hypothetical protein